jgi:hypothetical protein
MSKRREKKGTRHPDRARAETLPKGVAQYLALTMLRTQSESSMAPMMTALLTRRGSCRLRSDDFISAAASQLERRSRSLVSSHRRSRWSVRALLSERERELGRQGGRKARDAMLVAWQLRGGGGENDLA